MTQTWLWTGCIGMALGAIFFGTAAHKAQTQRWQILYILNFFICVIAAVLYLAMALGQGFDVVYDRPTYWVRYVTWSLSTPLLVLVLTFLAGSRLPITASLLGADILMIATGFVATVSAKPTNYIWYLVSCGAFLGMLYILFGVYRQEAERQHPRAKRRFGRLVTVHAALWIAYPIVWILSSTGLNLLSSSFETLGYTLLDLASKVGFGFLSISTLRGLERAGEAPQRLERVLQ